MDASKLNGFAVVTSPEVVSVSQVSGFAVVSDYPTDEQIKVSQLTPAAVVDNLSGRVSTSTLTAYVVIYEPPPTVTRPQVFIT